jgi:hypothetical protein
MTSEEKKKLGNGLISYATDVKVWLREEEDEEKKEQFQLLLDAIDIVLDSFEDDLELDDL